MVKLHEIYIIVKKRGLPAFHIKFKQTEQLDPDLVSGFITAIQHFAKELYPIEKKDINLIKREDFVIIIEDGEKTFGAVVADFEDNNARAILKRIVNNFEEEYHKYLDNFGLNLMVFEKFKEVVIKEFGALLVNPFYIPQFITTDHDLPEDPLISLIDGTKNIKEIADLLSVPVTEVCQTIALLESKDIIELKIKIEESDIFIPTGKATEAFSRETKAHKKIIELFNEEGIDVLYSLDGKKDLKAIENELSISFNQILKIIKYFLVEEFINWVELYPIMRKVTYEKVLDMVSDKQEQALALSLMNLCDGTYSLSTISRKLGVPRGEITKFLKIFGNNIRWIEKNI